MFFFALSPLSADFSSFSIIISIKVLLWEFILITYYLVQLLFPLSGEHNQILLDLGGIFQ